MGVPLLEKQGLKEQFSNLDGALQNLGAQSRVLCLDDPGTICRQLPVEGSQSSGT